MQDKNFKKLRVRFNFNPLFAGHSHCFKIVAFTRYAVTLTMLVTFGTDRPNLVDRSSSTGCCCSTAGATTSGLALAH